MKRRKAIVNMISLGLVTGMGFSFYKVYSIRKMPHISQLVNYKALICELAETIIPATDTPGAKNANVQDFIINVLTNCSSRKEQNNFIDGLEDLVSYCQDRYKKSFLECTLTEKNEIMVHFEQKDEYRINILNKISNRILGLSFYIKLKTLTVDGYCNSEVGAKHALAYDYIPGGYHSCIKLQTGQRSWATK